MRPKIYFQYTKLLAEPGPRAVILVGLLLLTSAAAASGDAAELVTDRPDQTESSVVVPRGTVQIETGWLRTEDSRGRVEQVTEQVPSTLVRVGAGERWELRLGWSGWIDERRTGRRGRSTEVDGAGDAELGAKISLWEESGGRPEAALLVATSLPVGDHQFTSDAFDPSFRLALSHTLSPRVGLGYNLGLAWASEDAPGGRSRLADVVYTLAVGFELAPRLGAFAELFGEIGASSEAPDRHSFDAGFTFLAAERLQLDLSGGVGLSDAAPDWFVGAGVSLRMLR